MIGQQLARFASGRVRQSHEVLQLEEVMQSVLACAPARPRPAASPWSRSSSRRAHRHGWLLFSLLNTTLDWALANAHAHIDFTIDFKTWPVYAG